MSENTDVDPLKILVRLTLPVAVVALMEAGADVDNDCPMETEALRTTVINWQLASVRRSLPETWSRNVTFVALPQASGPSPPAVKLTDGE